MKVSRKGNIYTITLESEADKSVYPVFDRPIAEVHVFLLEGIDVTFKYPTIGGYPKALNFNSLFMGVNSYPATFDVNVNKYGDFENPNYWSEKEIAQGE